jgi:hypothetical protein
LREIKIFTILLIIFFFILTSNVSAQIIYQENFDSMVVGTFPSGWDQYSSGRGWNYSVVNSSQSFSQPNSFKMEGAEGGSQEVGIPLTNPRDQIWFEARVMTDNAPIEFTDHRAGLASIFFSRTSPRENFGGALFAYDPSNHTYSIRYGEDSIPYTPKTWYKIKVVTDLKTHTFSEWIDDVVFLMNKPTGSQKSPDILLLNADNGGNYTRVWYDDIKIGFGLPEGETIPPTTTTLPTTTPPTTTLPITTLPTTILPATTLPATTPPATTPPATTPPATTPPATTLPVLNPVISPTVLTTTLNNEMKAIVCTISPETVEQGNMLLISGQVRGSESDLLITIFGIDNTFPEQQYPALNTHGSFELHLNSEIFMPGQYGVKIEIPGTTMSEKKVFFVKNKEILSLSDNINLIIGITLIALTIITVIIMLRSDKLKKDKKE